MKRQRTIVEDLIGTQWDEADEADGLGRSASASVFFVLSALTALEGDHAVAEMTKDPECGDLATGRRPNEQDDWEIATSTSSGRVSLPRPLRIRRAWVNFVKICAAFKFPGL